MKRSSRKAVLDALTGSSRDGCDPDWCAGVLFHANPSDVAWVSEKLRKNLPHEVDTLIRQDERG